MLKSLELFGFKSFADRTRFDFSSGITCVVGPNGSGKSNVVDAIKWILGDQSPKSLRGKEMTDVIFNGSAGHKPSAFAEASLSFDNASGFLPMDDPVIEIGRRIWRSGDSEYLINGNTARLKDIRDLFLGTGAAASAYSIIEQGRVDQILQANASARRRVFEEAAGISRYQARKVEALRKLERVAQNLLRLTDIVDEVEAQLNSTRNQASKAAKHRETFDELRQVWLGLAADDFRRFTAELNEHETSIGELQKQLETSNVQQDKLEEQLATADVDISEIDERLHQVERRGAATRENLARQEATIRHLTSRKVELSVDLTRLREQRTMMSARTREIVDRLQQTQKQTSEFEVQFAQEQDQVASRENQVVEFTNGIDERDHQIEQKRSEQLRLNQTITETRNRVAGLEAERHAAKEFEKSVYERGELLQQQVEVCEAQSDEKQIAVDEALTQTAAAESHLNDIEQRFHSFLDEKTQFQQTLAERREQRSAGHARLKLLEDLERRQEGLGIGVKEILDRARTSKHAPWNSILGSVADLLEVDLEDAALIEVALAARSQLVVVKEFTPLIEYLNAGTTRISGRVGFVALDGEVLAALGTNHVSEMDPNDSDALSHQIDRQTTDLSEIDGVVRRADQNVRSSVQAAGLAEQLLGNTWIVTTLAVAFQLADGPGRGCRFVTLQGELLESEGTLYSGTVRGESALLSRKSELRRLKTDLQKLDQNIDGEVRQLNELSESIGAVEAERKSADVKRKEHSDKLARLQANADRHNQERDRLRAERHAVDDEIEAIVDRQRRLDEDLQAAQLILAEREEDQSSLQVEIQQAEREVLKANHRVKTLQDRLTEDRLKLAKQEERLTALRNDCSRLDVECQQRDDQRDEAERRLTVALAKRRQTDLQILNTNAARAESYLTDEESANKASALSRERNKQRQERTRLVDHETQLRHQRRDFSDRQHEFEITARDIRHQLSTLSERIEEEYQVELADVVATGTSAFQDYLEEKGLAAADASDQEAAEVQLPDADLDENENENEKIERESAESIDPGEAVPVESQSTEVTVRLEDVRDEIETRVNRLRRKLKLMGSVNTDSLNDLDELESRYNQLSGQLNDLTEAKTTLEYIVTRINSESTRLFIESINAIRVHFQQLFRKLFGGGEGDIILEDLDDVLECGIDIVARPPGKELRSISLLSGGEKTMTAVALLLSIFRSSPSPFCILDEVDAALDDANVERYASVIKEFEETTQFIVITHRKRSMTVADILYGITMEQSGISKKMAVRFEDVSENGEIISTNRAA